MTTKKKSTELSRRDLLRRTAVGAGTVAVVGGGATKLDHGPVQEAEAIAPAVAAGGIAASAATGWVLRETEIIGSDDAPEGLTPEALINEAYNAARARESNNASTFVDNQNIVDYADQAAYSEAKRAAFEAIEDGKTESEVLDAAIEALENHIVTIQENLLKSWNESVLELDKYYQALTDHDDLHSRDVFKTIDNPEDTERINQGVDPDIVELVDGSEFETYEIRISYYGGSSTTPNVNYTPHSEDLGIWNEDYEIGVNVAPEGYSEFIYLRKDDWQHLYDSIIEVFDEVESGLETWVEGVYSEYQSGDIDSSQLLTARDRSEMTAEDEGFAQAQADLQTLNISSDIEREAEIYFSDLDTTLYGQLAYTGESEIETGQVDPDELDGVLYLTYDLAQGSGLWTSYEEGLDGGILALTEKPPSGYAFEIITTNDETAIVSSDDFDQSYDDDEEEYSEIWEADLSDQLDETIVDFELILTTEQSTQFETTRLDEPFEIVTFRDSDGQEYDGASFESSEPHSDDNYISQEEWEESQERHEELIEKYEDAQNSGIGFDVDQFGFGGIPGEGVVLAVLAAAAALMGSS